MSAVIPQVDPIRAKPIVAPKGSEKAAPLPPFVSDPTLPTHLDLPFEDGEIVENQFEYHQNRLLSDVLDPVLGALHPDGQFCNAADSGIYWRITNPPLKGCLAPDWFYIPNVPPSIVDGVCRRSYLIWQEHQRPLLVTEWVSGTGKEEHDRTPETGKFWVYENGICAGFYVIFDHWHGKLEVFQRIDGKLQPVVPNERGHYPIPPLGVELGIWRGTFVRVNGDWLRAWDLNGKLLPNKEEQLAIGEQRTEQEKQRAEQEKQRAEKLAAQLRALGLEPDA